MILYDVKERIIGEIDLQWPDNIDKRDTFRVFLDNPSERLSPIDIGPDIVNPEALVLKVLTFKLFKQGVMLVGGSIDDIEFDHTPNQLRLEKML